MTIRGELRRTGLVTLAVLVGTLTLALAVARVFHLGVAGTIVTVLVGGGGPAALYLTWATFRDSTRNAPQPDLVEWPISWLLL